MLTLEQIGALRQKYSSHFVCSKHHNRLELQEVHKVKLPNREPQYVGPCGYTTYAVPGDPDLLLALDYAAAYIGRKDFFAAWNDEPDADTLKTILDQRIQDYIEAREVILREEGTGKFLNFGTFTRELERLYSQIKALKATCPSDLETTLLSVSAERAHPLRTGRHDLYAMALELIQDNGAFGLRNKASVTNLVNFLLTLIPEETRRKLATHCTTFTYKGPVAVKPTDTLVPTSSLEEPSREI